MSARRGGGRRAFTQLAAFALLAGLAAAAAPGLAAQQRELRADRMEVDLTVTTGGALLVRERITYRFDGSWNGVFRTIPVAYDGPGGFDYRLDLSLQAISIEGEGSEPRVETSRSGGEVTWKVWVPGAVDATRTVVFDYRVENALRFFEEHDELYWNVIGDDSDVPFGRVVARVNLPSGATGIRTRGLVGAYGARDEAGVGIEANSGVLEFSSVEPLGWRRGMTVVVGWNAGLVARPTRADLVLGFLRSNILLLLPFLSWGAVHRRWLKRGRDPEGRPIMPQYEPPDGMGPAEAGTIVDHKPHLHDLTATIVDLAVRGWVRIEEVPPEGLLSKILSRPDYAFVRREDPVGDTLRLYEARTIEALFGARHVPGARVTTSDLENEFYRDIPKIRDAIFDELTTKRLYVERPDKVRGRWAVGGVLLSVFGAVGLVALQYRLGISPVTAAVAGAGMGIPLLIYSWIMPARTREGARATEHVRGLEEFLSRVEQDRFRRMITTPEQFEALLPYAMALEVDEKWADAFDDLFTEPPDWYVGRYDGGFRTGHLIGSLNSWASRTGSAMTTAPRSSSGSTGFRGGGGFSGGGFGGGSTGGF